MHAVPHLVLAVAICCLSSVSGHRMTEKATVRGRSWMGDNLHLIGNRTLQQLTLPGTHDSASYSVTADLTGVPPFIDALIKVADALGIEVGSLIDSWAKSQDRTFYQQFEDGIRYVDLRACFDPATKSWRTHHGVVLGNQMQVVLNDTKVFLSQNPQEIVVVEISHDTDGSCDGSQTPFNQLVQMIDSMFTGLLIPKAGGFNATVQQLLAANTRALISIDSPYVTSEADLWPGDTIINSYANSDNLTTMEQYNVDQVAVFHKTDLQTRFLYKISWTLTPNTQTVLDMLLPNHPKNLIELADKASKAIDPWFDSRIAPQKLQYPVLSNIVIIDHYETSDICAVVLRGL